MMSSRPASAMQGALGQSGLCSENLSQKEKRKAMSIGYGSFVFSTVSYIWDYTACNLSDWLFPSNMHLLCLFLWTGFLSVLSNIPLSRMTQFMLLKVLWLLPSCGNFLVLLVCFLFCFSETGFHLVAYYDFKLAILLSQPS
jgi:hypothetical protein